MAAVAAAAAAIPPLKRTDGTWGSPVKHGGPSLPAAAAALCAAEALAAAYVTAVLSPVVHFAIAGGVCAVFAGLLSASLCSRYVARPLRACTVLLGLAADDKTGDAEASAILTGWAVSSLEELGALLARASAVCAVVSEYRCFVPDLAVEQIEAESGLPPRQQGGFVEEGIVELALSPDIDAASAWDALSRTLQGALPPPSTASVASLGRTPGHSGQLGHRRTTQTSEVIASVMSETTQFGNLSPISTGPQTWFPNSGLTGAGYDSPRRGPRDPTSSQRGELRRPSFPSPIPGLQRYPSIEDPLPTGSRLVHRTPPGAIGLPLVSAPTGMASPTREAANAGFLTAAAGLTASPTNRHSGQNPRRTAAALGLSARTDVGTAEWRLQMRTTPTSSPADICYVLCCVLDEVTGAVRSAGGAVQHATGDTIVAHWNAKPGPAAVSDDRGQMIDCTVSVAERAARTSSTVSTRGYPSFRLCCGLAHGTASCGNVGGSRFKTFAVCGRPPRDAGICASVAVELACDAVVTAAFVGNSSAHQLRCLGSVATPDARVHAGPQMGAAYFSYRITVYQLMTPLFADELDISRYTTAFEAVLSEDWSAAQYHLHEHLDDQEDYVAERLQFIVRQHARRRKSGFFGTGIRKKDPADAVVSVCTSLCPLFIWEKAGFVTTSYRAAEEPQAATTSDSDGEEAEADRQAQSRVFAEVQNARQRQSQVRRNTFQRLELRARNASTFAYRSETGDSGSPTLAAIGSSEVVPPVQFAAAEGSAAECGTEGLADPFDITQTQMASEFGAAVLSPKSAASGGTPRVGPRGSHPRARRQSVVSGLISRVNSVRRARFHTSDQEHGDMLLRNKVRRLKFWHALLLLALMYNAFLVPLRYGFQIGEIHTTMLVLNFVLDFVVYYIHIGLTLVTPFEEGAQWVTDPARIRARYARGDLALDVACCFPLELVALLWERPLYGAVVSPIYRTNRVLSIVRLPSYFDSFFGYWAPGLNPIVVRIQQFMICVLFLVHFAACGLAVVLIEGGNIGTLPTGRVYFNEEWGYQLAVERYWSAFDWAVRALSGYGHRFPLTDLQVVYTLVTCMVGVAVYATVIAIITSLVTSLGAYTDQFRNKMDELCDYIVYVKMPKDLADEILGYYRYLWKSQKTLNSAETPLDGLPDDLQQKVNFAINCNVMRKVPLFNAVKDNEDFILDLVSGLTLSVLLPDSYIFRAGEMGDAMYFIGHGRVRIEDARCNPMADLGEGHFFGEVALLYGMTRTASVKALTFTHVYVLTKRQFTSIGMRYPECLVEVLMTAEHRLKANERGFSDEQRDMLLRIFNCDSDRDNPVGNWARALNAFRRTRRGREPDQRQSLFLKRISQAIDPALRPDGNNSPALRSLLETGPDEAAEVGAEGEHGERAASEDSASACVVPTTGSAALDTPLPQAPAAPVGNPLVPRVSGAATAEGPALALQDTPVFAAAAPVPAADEPSPPVNVPDVSREDSMEPESCAGTETEQSLGRTQKDGVT
eukprot:TRINITY_DN12092_c0_g2_i1.p1 TRINITY_DN12092_c0_g2~~TRINITY_DN12092_c0_g2_i1.p1  ORF type:complete len:1506 (+),score=275.04 TRINITY_DN12092_c0_g2_i1:74-4591(+)